MDQTGSAPRDEPWNKGKLVGQKAPLRVRDIWAIRIRLQLQSRTRDLALFDLGIDSKLRACDLVRLRVRDVWSTFSCTPETRFHQRRSTRWPAGSIFLPRTRGSFPKPYGIWLHSGSRRLSLVIARAGARRTRWWMPLVRTP